MAPEQLLGQRADAASDQFSFCVSLYEALYGVTPFEGADLFTLSSNVRSGKVREPPAGSRAVPGWVRQIVRRGIEPQSRRNRYLTMGALLRDLEHDPSVLRKRALALLCGGAMVAGLSVVAARRVAARLPPCSAGSALVEGRMERRGRGESAHAAFVATGRAYADDTFGTAYGLTLTTTRGTGGARARRGLRSRAKRLALSRASEREERVPRRPRRRAPRAGRPYLSKRDRTNGRRPGHRRVRSPDRHRRLRFSRSHGQPARTARGPCAARAGRGASRGSRRPRACEGSSPAKPAFGHALTPLVARGARARVRAAQGHRCRYPRSGRARGRGPLSGGRGSVSRCARGCGSRSIVSQVVRGSPDSLMSRR